MQTYDFSKRAEEYLRLAQHATTERDRELFTSLARAWYGLIDDEPLVLVQLARH
jgi:hypothetical protein